MQRHAEPRQGAHMGTPAAVPARWMEKRQRLPIQTRDGGLKNGIPTRQASSFRRAPNSEFYAGAISPKMVLNHHRLPIKTEAIRKIPENSGWT